MLYMYVYVIYVYMTYIHNRFLEVLKDLIFACILLKPGPSPWPASCCILFWKPSHLSCIPCPPPLLPHGLCLAPGTHITHTFCVLQVKAAYVISFSNAAVLSFLTIIAALLWTQGPT